MGSVGDKREKIVGAAAGGGLVAGSNLVHPWRRERNPGGTLIFKFLTHIRMYIVRYMFCKNSSLHT